MDSKAPTTPLIPVPNPSENHKPLTKQPSIKDRDFLKHLEAYLAKRDGVDKLLKIARYAAKLSLASSALPETLTLTRRLRSFESSVGLSRKAFRLGKFVQDVNALRDHSSQFDSKEGFALAAIAYGGEGIYYFVEQFVWLTKSGLIDPKHSKTLQKISAWAELVGYIGSLGLKFRDLNRLREDEKCLESSIGIAILRGIECRDEREKLRKLREKKIMKKLSIVQDLADGLMALADIRDGKGLVLGPFSVSFAGLVSALISTHKNWISC